MRYRPARAALAIWNASHARSPSDRRYAGYLGVMVAIAFVAPAVRALWGAVSQPHVLHALVAPEAPLVGGLCVAGLWVFALLFGGLRGPALRPPLLTYTFARSDLSRISAFGGSVVRAGAALTATTAMVGAALGTLLGVARGVTLLDLFAVASLGACIGACVGVIATLAWLTGQAVPRVARASSAALAILTGITIALPSLTLFTPWGWVAALWREAALSAGELSVGASWLVPLALLCALALVLMSIVPTLFARLDTQVLESQAARWAASAVHAYGMDFNAALSTYRGSPWAGRRVRAVRAGPRGRRGVALARTFLIRDVLGAARTPGRLTGGAVGVAAASVAVTLASSATEPGFGFGVLSALAAVLAFGALGPFTDGVRHAAAVSADLPVYGVGDAHLLALHTVFPVLAVLMIGVIAASISAFLLGAPPLAAVLGSAIVGMCAVLARASNALKGPLPLRLLAPIPTPEGDLSGAVRFVWSIDGVVLVALVGATAPLALIAPAWCIAACSLLAAVCAARWRGRRTVAG